MPSRTNFRYTPKLILAPKFRTPRMAVGSPYFKMSMAGTVTYLNNKTGDIIFMMYVLNECNTIFYLHSLFHVLYHKVFGYTFMLV